MEPATLVLGWDLNPDALLSIDLGFLLEEVFQGFRVWIGK